METLAQRLRHARKERKLSQEELAAQSGLKQSDISKLETGKMLKTTGMARLARALRVPDAWLELGEGSEPEWSNGGQPPPPPPPKFKDRHEVSDSDFALLTDIRDLEAMPEMAKRLHNMLEEMRALRQHLRTSERIKALQDAGGGWAGGTSAFGDLDGDTREATEPKPRGKR